MDVASESSELHDGRVDALHAAATGALAPRRAAAVGADDDLMERHAGSHFMRERAAFIGAHSELRFRRSGGTVVRLAIPLGEESR